MKVLRSPIQSNPFQHTNYKDSIAVIYKTRDEATTVHIPTRRRVYAALCGYIDENLKEFGSAVVAVDASFFERPEVFPCQYCWGIAEYVKSWHELSGIEFVDEMDEGVKVSPAALSVMKAKQEEVDPSMSGEEE